MTKELHNEIERITKFPNKDENNMRSWINGMKALRGNVRQKEIDGHHEVYEKLESRNDSMDVQLSEVLKRESEYMDNV